MKIGIVDHIAELTTREGNRPIIVTVDGFSGSGKTSLAEGIARELNSRGRGYGTLLLEVELWARGWGDLAGGVRRVNDVVEGLQSGPTETQTWNWWTETLEDPIVLKPKPVILVVGSGSGQIHSDLAIWLDAPRDTRRERVARRDPYDWSDHWEEWESQELGLLEVHDSRAHADIQIGTTNNDRE